MHGIPTSILLSCLVLAIPGFAQEGASLPKGVEALASALDSSHRLGDALRELRQFSGVLHIETRGQHEDSIEIELRASYLAPRFIRYRIEEEGEIIERGRDRIGVWDRVGDDVRALSAREYQKDREQVDRHLHLAAQLLKFLDPGALLRSMKALSLVQTEELPLGRRGKKARFTTVSGQVDSFPLYALDEVPDRVEIKLMVDPESHRLRAVRIRPLNMDGKPLPGGELVMLQDFVQQQGRLLPTSLTTYRLLERGHRRPYVTLKVFQIDLAPDLSAKDMARPRN